MNLFELGVWESLGCWGLEKGYYNRNLILFHSSARNIYFIYLISHILSRPQKYMHRLNDLKN